MNYEEVLDKLDKTFIGDLELKIALTKAVEKQIAKKPEREIWLDFCVGCGTSLDFPEEYSYCPHCGQALDWSVEINKKISGGAEMRC